ncbi:uncharacterized protein LOC143211121 [Lasioglossum baleicum]|uniref:uncharacterized protein LOC143211121 n=1 Tax=Lasioglossum baleicum TaxID=434251 RepID=UPI003FCC7D8B
MGAPASLTQGEIHEALWQPPLPVFYKQDPSLWFAIVEGSLSEARISNQNMMADLVVVALEFDVLITVKDIPLITPPPEDIYDRIKARIISNYAISVESKLRQCSSEGKPSQILTRLRNLNHGYCSDELIRAIFLEKLPAHVRAILVIADVSELQKLAELADMVVEAYKTDTSATAAVSPASLRALQEEVDRLANQLAALTTSRVRESRGRRRIPSRSRNRSRASRSRSKRNICWYHRKFGKDAHHCRRKCSWKAGN